MAVDFLDENTFVSSMDTLISRINNINLKDYINSQVRFESFNLRYDNWNNQNQNASVSNLKDEDNIIILPDDSTREEYNKSGVFCASQNNNILTFNCLTTPTTDLKVISIIFKA